MKIADIFETRITEKIEPVIKVGEVQDEHKLAAEIGSFVVTPHIEAYMDDFLDHYTDTIRKETTEIGIWISGYFGSGKSHLAKMLALVTGNRTLDGISAAKRFDARVPQSAGKKKSLERSLSLLTNCDTNVLAFNLNTLTDSRRTPLPTLLLSQYYQSRGYGSNHIFAKVIEAELDKMGKLTSFHQEVETLAGKPWPAIQANPNFYRKHLYNAVCRIAPEMFSTPEEVSEALRNAERGEIYNTDFLVRTIIADIRDQENRTRKPTRLFFILDESGHWIEDNLGRLSQLQSLVEEAAALGQGKIWIVVTTHEDMGSVFKNARALDTDFKKIEERFRFKFGLTTENIELVLEDRIFKKTLNGKKEVEALYQENPGVIRSMGELKGVSQALPACNEVNFVKFYPFFPYHLHLIPEIVKTLRARGGRSDSLSGSTRTLLAITQDVIRAGRRKYLEAPVGETVSFDEIYFNLVHEGEISSDIRREISKISEAVKGSTDLTSKLVEVLYLIGELAYLPKTADNLARFLATDASQDLTGIKPAIDAELEKLRQARIVARIGDEWEFLTGERRTFEEAVDTVSRQLKYQDREEGLSHLVTTHTLGFDTIPFKGHDFQVRLSFDNKLLTKNGHIEVRLVSPFGHYTGQTISGYENESVKQENHQKLYVICGPVHRFSEQLDRYIAMREVVDKWRGDAGKSTAEHELANTKLTNDLPKLKDAVEASIRQGLRQGHLIFRGSSRAIACKKDQNPGEAVRLEIGHYFGSLYPKFDKLPVRIKSEQKDIVDVLAGVKALSQDVKSLKIYDNAGQLNNHCPLLDEIRLFLSNRQSHNQRTLGHDILCHFEKPPYGWDPNALRIGIAAMVRAGAVKIMVGKKAYTNPSDSELIATLRNSKTFNKAEVVLEETEVDIAVLTAVRKLLIKLTGNRKIDETPSGITAASVPYLENVKGRGDSAQIWAKAAGFPLPEAFTIGMETIATLLNLTNPVHHIKQWGAKADAIEGELKAVLDVHAFYTKWADTFQETRALCVSLQTIQAKIPQGNIIHHFIANFSTAQQDASVHLAEIWQALQDNKAHVLTEIESLKRQWRDEARNGLTPLKSHLEVETASGMLTSSDLAPFEHSLQRKMGEIEDESELIKVAMLPDHLGIWVQDQLRRVDQLVDSKGPGDSGYPRPVKKIRLVSAPRRIRSLDEWNALKSEMDAKISNALGQGEEVELS